MIEREYGVGLEKCKVASTLLEKDNDYLTLNNIHRRDLIMFFIKTNKREKYAKGYSLVKLIVVISTIAILSTFAVSAYNGYRKKAIEKVCNTNCLQLERMYHVYLD